VPPVKLVDVARAAGVHPGTASRALNPETAGQVNSDTRRRIVRVAKDLGYVPNALARGLRTSRSYVVAMVVPDITNPLFPPMVRAAEQVLSEAGYTLVLTDTDNDDDTERRQLERLRAGGTDGFIMATARWDDPQLDALATSKVPTVLVNRNTGTHRLPYIGGDERTGMRLAVEHLAALGHTQVVYLSGPHDTSTGRERSAAFRQAIRTYTEVAGAEVARKLLVSRQEFTAIVAGNDLIAMGVLSVLAEHGIKCPTEVSVIGFNDMTMVNRLTPPLTTVRLPLERIGHLAARTLLAELESGPQDAGAIQTLLGVELMVRGTTAPAPK
jgi:LacI family transcriptional regulator